jgi:CubicO group peptidase (beta-lactamase class C family)
MASSRLRSLLDDFRERNKVPAVGGGVVTAEHEDISVVGVRRRDGDDAVLPGDRWHIGSCAKSITAALFARLVERGDAKWESPLPELFQDLGSIDSGWASVTIYDVFVSQAGLPANLTRSEMRAAFDDTRPLVDQRTEIAAGTLARPPRSAGRVLYSNLGYIVIGAAIERLAGAPFESALENHVFRPLKMTSAGFGPPPHLCGHSGRMLALGPMLFDLGRGGPVEPRAPLSDNPPIMTPAGRIHVALKDWATFHRMLLANGRDFLRPESVEMLLMPAAGRGYRMSPGWAPAKGLGQATLGQQGSNTYWVATALMDAERGRTAMVVCNEGRGRLLKRTPKLAAKLLSDTD